MMNRPWNWHRFTTDHRLLVFTPVTCWYFGVVRRPNALVLGLGPVAFFVVYLDRLSDN